MERMPSRAAKMTTLQPEEVRKERPLIVEGMIKRTNPRQKSAKKKRARRKLRKQSEQHRGPGVTRRSMSEDASEDGNG